ncbi:hypothetical protein FZI91_02135 [Mycobacterium sp. CBMA271]|uniref:hypothetical protein n=1 Tax=unclassified Mycobacteroides TaxID=2618759 RepID=UPI0012DC3FD4|nr:MULTISPECIES: hypothetical protein [unclassified Mycobacteroides]MUM17935.1 hypothetical protein [Mycobacteroides sp. CBMA 326]MUM20504.1 hypothetical protein [Mycobacteroides sp. CBMA 271]
MNTLTNYGDTLWRDAHGVFVVSPIAPPSLQMHAAAKPAVAMSPAGSVSTIKHRAVAAAANVASVSRGYI